MKRHRKYLMKLMMELMELINPNQDSRTVSNDMATTDQLWFWMPSLMLKGIMYVNPCWFHPLITGIPTLDHYLMAIQEVGGIGPINLLYSRGHRLLLVIIDYFSNLVEVVPVKKVKILDMVTFIKPHVIYQFDMSRLIMIIIDISSSSSLPIVLQ